MHNPRNLTRPLLRLSGLVAAATAGIIGLSAGAGAGTTPGNPVISAVPHVAAAASAPQTVTESYSCDTSVLRPSQSAPSPGDLNLSLTLTAPATGIEGTSANVTLGFPATPLASGVSVDIPALDSITLSGTGPVNATAGSGVALSGSGGPVTANPAELPAVTATGTLPLTAVGTTTVAIPPQIRVNLSAGGKVIAGLLCGGNEGEVKINVTAPPPPPPVAPSAGPVYSCKMFVPLINQVTPLGRVPFPFQAIVTGHRTTGSTDLVTVGLNLGSAAALSGPSEGVAGTAFSTILPVTGAGHGSITAKGTTKGLTSQIFTGSGSLFLRSPGTYRIWTPKSFTWTVYSPPVKYRGKYITISSIMTCKLLLPSAASVLYRLTVTGKAVPVATAGSGGQGETSANGAVPAGAPNTGGGPRPGSDLPMVFGGAALLLLGGGGIVYAARRRRLGQPAA